MLFKKTFKAASAATLWMVALLGVNSAMAQTLDTYSAEALTASSATATMYGVNSTTDLSATMTAGERVAYYMRVGGTRNVYVRVSASGMAFAEGNEPDLFIDEGTANATTGVIEFAVSSQEIGGRAAASGGGFRWAVSDQDDNDDADALRLRVVVEADGADTPEALVSSVGQAGVSISVYDTEEDAHFAEGTPHQGPTSTPMFNVASSVKVGTATADPEEHTASAAAQFRQLTDGPGKYSLGGFNVTVAEGHLNAAGVSLRMVALAGEVDAEQELTMAEKHVLYTQVGIARTMSSSKFRGADGQGFAYASSFELNSEPNCSGHGPMGADSDATGIGSYPGMEVEEGEDAPNANEVIGGIAANAWHLCVGIAEDNEETIPEGDIMMDIALAADMVNRLVSPSAASMDGFHVASIEHDGTTVQIPYVTTYENYNQRLVINNRSKVDAYFTVEFQTEAENAAGDAIMVTSDNPTGMMTAAGGQTTVLRMADLVTIENATRAAATVVIQAGPATVDVATTIVSKNDGSTDTIILQKN